ncbi:hypothetical protein AB2713_19180 [Citrobacter werkmanii]
MVALDRKNYLFVGSASGGKTRRSCIR